MDACGSRRLFYQRFVWLCQHAGIYSNSQFWIGKCQYFSNWSAVGLSGQCDSYLEKPKKSGSESVYPVGSPGTGRQYSRSISVEKCGCQSDQAGIWSGSSRTGCGDAFQRVQQKTRTFLPAGAGDHRCGSRGFVRSLWCGRFAGRLRQSRDGRGQLI